jgi:foldase protein PrsA
MLKTSLRTITALAIFSVLGIFLSACGSSGSIPDNAVATVDGTPITKASYQHWALITAKSTGSTVVPDPPTYTKCITSRRNHTKLTKGQPKPTDKTLKTACKTLNGQVMQGAMSTLLQGAWVAAEAKQQGVTVSDAEVKKELAKTKKSLPAGETYSQLLKQSGMTQADALYRIRLQALVQKLTAKIEGSATGSTAGQKKLAAFAKDFQTRWREKTDCRKGYVITQCSNGPNPPSTTSSTATPPSTQSAPPAQSGGSAAGTGK